MVVTNYSISSNEIKRDYTFVMLSDIHSRPYRKIMEKVKDISPDAIFVVGDLVDRHLREHDRALPFLRACVKLAPTYFVYGNHEIRFPILTQDEIIGTGVTLLDNSWTLFNEDILIGGQRPGADHDWLRDFEDNDQFSILLDHHPEHYPQYLKEEHPEIDLIVSGHAHGGQMILRGRAILAPNQGFFPKYTKGYYDGRLIVGTGLANTGIIFPRINNPTEIVVLNFHREEVLS